MEHFVQFEDVSKYYQTGSVRIAAADHLNFYVDKGEFCIIVGPSGAGKTTLLNILGGMDTCDEGHVWLDGQDVSHFSEKELTTYRRYDVGFVFQFYNLVQNLTALENVELASEICRDPLDPAATLESVGLGERLNNFLSLIHIYYWKEEKHCTERAFELLDIFHMADMAYTQAGSLPYGAQRRLEIMRALATSPKLLLLDEPAAGMNPSETAELTETIRRIRDEFNIAVLLIEHDMSLVMGICEGIAVLNFGRIIAKGTPDEIRNNPQVIEAYLGKKEG